MKYPDLKRAKNYPDEFKSGCHLHVGASVISLAPTFFKSQSALILLLLLSKSNPLTLGFDLALGAALQALHFFRQQMA